MFILKCALKKLLYSKKICLIFILSIAAGVICPIYVLGYIHTAAAKDKMSRMAFPEDYMLVNGSMPFMDEAALENMTHIVGGTLEDYECAYQTTVNWQNTNGVAFVGGVSIGILSRVPVYLKEGRLFDSSDYEADAQPVCILTDNSILYQAGARVGDEVSFMGNTYKVIGAIDGWGSNLISAILLPYPQMYYVSGESSIQHRFIIPKGEEGLGDSIMAKTNAMLDVDIYSVTSMAEEEAAAGKIIANQNRKWLLTGFAVCLFAFLSIFAISEGQSLEEQRMIGLHKALGATSKHIFLEVFIQKLVLVAVALGIDALVLSMPLEKVLKMDVLYSKACIAQVIVLGVALALILSLLSLRTSKKSVRRLIDSQAQ